MDEAAEVQRIEEKAVTIRPMQESDIPALAQTERRIFSQPWSEQSFRELLAYDYKMCLVAEQKGAVLGCAVLTRLGMEAEIDKVMVEEEYRGQGIGRLLTQELLKYGGQSGAEEFTLEVRQSNTAAIRLYETLGFVSEGIRPGFYEKPKEDALIMWRRRPQ